MHLRQPKFTYSACGPFIKNREWKQNFKKIGGSPYNTAKNLKCDEYQC